MKRSAMGRGKPIRRVSVKMRRRQDRYATLRRAVYARSDGRCERCAKAIDPVIFECHHRQMRSAGGKDSLYNCVALCSACHSAIHARPAESYANGWLVTSTGDPAFITALPLSSPLYAMAQTRNSA